MLETVLNSSHNLLWDVGTIYLYIIIISTVGTVGFICQSKYISINNKWLLFIFSFCILFYFSAFRTIGIDTQTYKAIFSAAGRNQKNTFLVEPGYWIFNRLAFNISNNPQFIIILTTILTLFFIYKAMWYFKNSISVGVACFAFVSIFYFQSYNLTRMYLTASFLLYSFKYLSQGKHKKYAICVAIAVLFHYSAILMFFPFGVYFVYKKNKIFFYLILILVFMGGVISIANIHKISIFARYSAYLKRIFDTPFGIGQLIYHLPFIMLGLHLRKKKCKHPMYDFLIVYTMCSLLLSYLSYKIHMLGRISIFYNILYLIIAPYLLNYLKQIKDKKYRAYNLMFVVYIVFRCIMYFKEYLFLDGIMPYQNIF